MLFKDFFFLLWMLFCLAELHHFSNFGGGSLKKSSCKIISKSINRFRRCLLSKFLTGSRVYALFLFLVLVIPTLFRKSIGDIVIASVRPSVRYVISSQIAGQNPTKFGEWLAYTSGACKSTFIFGPAPRGPGEGSKGQILTISNFKVNFKDFYAKMCTYTQQ